MSEFRYNKLTNNWVLFAPKRAKKPLELKLEKSLSKNETCPFCAGNEHLTPNEILRIEDQNGYRCRIVPNLYNALCIDQKIENKKEKAFEKKSGFGAHEVIIETPNHNKQMTQYSVKEFYDYFHIISLRTKDLKKDIRLKYFSIFKNQGLDSGASQQHSHSQLIATPFIPPKIKKELLQYETYKKEHERDFFDDLIYDEKLFSKGTLNENNYFYACCPYASQYPFEVLIIAKNNLVSIDFIEQEQLQALAEICRFVFKKLDMVLEQFSFNMVLKNGDIQNKNNPNRFYIRIMPRVFKTAGFELDTDIFINTFLPETAALELLKN